MPSSTPTFPPAPASTAFRQKIARPIIFPATSLESTLPQVLIPPHFNSFRRNVYKKPGEGGLIWLTKIVAIAALEHFDGQILRPISDRDQCQQAIRPYANDGNIGRPFVHHDQQIL